MRLKKLVSLLSAMALTLVMAAGCAEKKASFTEYAESDAFRFYAYMTPPPANTGSGELANNPDFMTEEQYQWVAECGFNYAIPIYEGTFENNLKAMDMLGKYGVQYFPQDQSLASLASQLNDPTKTEAEIEASKAQAAANVAEYLKRDNFAGVYASDEPSAVAFPGLKAAGEYFKSLAPGKEWWINVHPNSATSAVLGMESYVAYLNEYAQNTSIDRMSFDSYPLMTEGLKEGHLANLGQVAAVATAYGYDYDSFILTMGHHSYRTPDNYDDLAWQIYAAMAFGTKGIETFTYWTTQTTGENVTHGLVNYYGEREQSWYSMQEVISEVRSFEKMFMNAEWKGVLTYEADPDYPNFSLRSIPRTVEVGDKGEIPVRLDPETDPDTGKIVGEWSDAHERIADMDATNDFLMGVFEDKDARDAFLLVNISDPADDVTNEVTIRFNDCSRVVLYKKGRKLIVDLNDGVFKTTIGSGEGYYIIPLK